MKTPGLPTRVSSTLAFLWLLLLIAVVLLTLYGLLFTSQSHAGTIVSSNGNSTDNVPFGISNLGTANYLGRYQQIYRSGLFPAPALITQIAFKDASKVPADNAAYTLSIGFGVTARTPNNPGTGFATGATTVFYKTTLLQLTQAAGDFDMVFTLDTPFLYDPTQGSLLLDVMVFSASGKPGNSGFSVAALQVDTSNMARILDVGQGIVVKPLWGLATQFTTAPVPEPATVALLFLGGSLAFTRRSRKAR